MDYQIGMNSGTYDGAGANSPNEYGCGENAGKNGVGGAGGDGGRQTLNDVPNEHDNPFLDIEQPAENGGNDTE